METLEVGADKQLLRCGGSRYRQMRRFLTICELLHSFRFGLTIPELIDAIEDSIGERYCKRTIYRDLAFLEQCNWIQQVAKGGRVAWTWRRIVANPLAEKLPSEVSTKTVTLTYWRVLRRQRGGAA